MAFNSRRFNCSLLTVIRLALVHLPQRPLVITLYCSQSEIGVNQTTVNNRSLTGADLYFPPWVLKRAHPLKKKKSCQKCLHFRTLGNGHKHTRHTKAVNSGQRHFSQIGLQIGLVRRSLINYINFNATAMTNHTMTDTPLSTTCNV